ncbi:hypothetical protein L2725_02515 [Shewanella corallii]|uniref:Uncharacterized protein n=1 Tax=Shewanella corallii TaxID=560080 RepID=A0ABT0N2L7_9GAMM|nr:hypothetical protein [Shewanella corallii]MCL2912662.1 hypothetical protein [Shewanella corallii]
MSRKILCVLWMSMGLTAYATPPETRCNLPQSGMSPEQAEMLGSWVLEQEFMSGCVTEELADLCEAYCPETNGACDDNWTRGLNLSQWRSVYQGCLAPSSDD